MLPLIHPATVARVDFRTLRSELQISQSDFWGAVGLTQSAGSRYEKANRKISTPLLIALGTVYYHEIRDYLMSVGCEIYIASVPALELSKSDEGNTKVMLEGMPVTRAPELLWAARVGTSSDADVLVTSVSSTETFSPSAFIKQFICR